MCARCTRKGPSRGEICARLHSPTLHHGCAGSATLCASDEHVQDHVCTPCNNGATNTAGDNAAGPPTSCVGGSTPSPTPSPTTAAPSPAPPPSVDGCEATQRLDIFPTKIKRKRVQNFAQYTLKAFRSGSLNACQTECIAFNNECVAVEYNFRTTACHLKSATSAVGTVQKGSWNLFERAHFCQPSCPDATIA